MMAYKRMFDYFVNIIEKREKTMRKIKKHMNMMMIALIGTGTLCTSSTRVGFYAKIQIKLFVGQCRLYSVL